MRVITTGAAGFIGSHLAEALAARGDEVMAIDGFTPYYQREIKEANAAAVRKTVSTFIETDLRGADLDDLLEGAEVVFHLAAQPGIRTSWQDFSTYVEHNIVVTHRLLEAARRHDVRLVVASSSSVYGNAERYPVQEDDVLRPFSPYGVTKRGVEDLCVAYADNWGLSCALLRYFTVYGPRQRPDMATQRMIIAALDGTEFPLYGDGSAVRDFTYVDDIVAATIAAGDAHIQGARAYNFAGGAEASVSELLDAVGAAVGSAVPVEPRQSEAGDVRRTGGVIERAVTELAWRPKVTLEEGIKRQVEWVTAQARPAPT